MSKISAGLSTAVLATVLMATSAMAQGAPLQLLPPSFGTADLNIMAEEPIVTPDPVIRQAAAGVPVDAARAAKAAGASVAPRKPNAAAHASPAKHAAPKAAVKSAKKSSGKATAKAKSSTIKGKKKGAKNGAAAMPLPVVEPAAPLTGDAAWNRLIGNSISGSYNGQPLTDVYFADNTVKTRNGGEVTTGRWGLVDGKVCFQYPPETQATCYAVSVDGDDVVYTDGDGESFHFALGRGIPEGF